MPVEKIAARFLLVTHPPRNTYFRWAGRFGYLCGCLCNGLPYASISTFRRRSQKLPLALRICFLFNLGLWSWFLPNLLLLTAERGGASPMVTAQ